MAATAFGLAVVLWALRSVGTAGLIEATHRIGAAGAFLYILYSLGVFLLLGAAWLTATPDEPPARVGLFAWARLVREAVADLLPFSQLGGLIAGARTLTAHGIAKERVYASIIADMTSEMASQLLFTLFGLFTIAPLLFGAHATPLRSAAIGCTVALALIIAVVLLGQRPLIGLAARLARRMLPGAAMAIAGIDRELDRAYARRGHIALSFIFNLAAWVASAGGAWLLLWLIDVRLPLLLVLALESLIFTVRSVAFAVPGALGFQEAAYILVGPLFGLPPETALALSIAKRARDVAIGLPALSAWQIIEVRAIFSRNRQRSARESKR